MSHADAVRALLDQVALIELAPPVLARALEPFPLPVRILDALHLAAIAFLRTHGQTIELASYDNRLVDVARALGIRPFAFWDARIGSRTSFGQAAAGFYDVPPAHSITSSAWASKMGETSRPSAHAVLRLRNSFSCVGC